MDILVIVAFVIVYLFIGVISLTNFNEGVRDFEAELRKLGYSNITTESYGVFSTNRQFGRYKVHFTTSNGQQRSQDVQFDLKGLRSVKGWRWLSESPDGEQSTPHRWKGSKEVIIDELSAENEALRNELQQLRAS